MTPEPTGPSDGRTGPPRAGCRLALGCAALAALFAALAVCVVVRLAEVALNRLTIDPAAVRQALAEWVEATVADGTPDQKLEILRTLGEMGADARPFAPAIAPALEDEDERVRAAAAEALKRIDAARQAGVP